MKLLFILACMCTLSLSSFKSTDKKPESAMIFIYRGGQFSGSLSNWSIFVDEEKICKLSNNKYIKFPVQPGKHKVTARVAGVGILKKETEVEIDAESGGNYYVACNIKSSIVRARLEMVEVTKSTATKQMENMTLDKCETGDPDKQ